MKKQRTRLGWTAAALAGIVTSGCEDPGDRPSPSPASSESQASATASSGLPYAAGQIALSEIYSETNPYRRVERLAAFLSVQDDSALPLVEEALDPFDWRLGGAEYDLLLRFWAERDPKAALAWAVRVGSPIYKMGSIRSVVESWAFQDPAAALSGIEIVELLSTDETLRISQVAHVQGWYRKNPEELEEFIRGLGIGRRRQRALRSFTHAMNSDRGPTELVRWGEAVSEEDMSYKLDVHRQLLGTLVWNKESEMAERYCDNYCDGPFGKGLRNILTRARFRSGDDPAAILEWVGKTPEIDAEQTDNKYHSLWVAYTLWAAQDREAAVDWMTQHVQATDPVTWLPALYEEYARHLATESPAQAIPWAERIEKVGPRERALVRIARKWLQSDAEGAERWLAQSDLSKAGRARARDFSIPSFLPPSAKAPQAEPAP